MRTNRTKPDVFSVVLSALLFLAGSVAASAQPPEADQKSSESAQQAAPAEAVPKEAVRTASPVSEEDKERFQREVLNSKDLPNFHEVHPFLWRGGEPTEVGLHRLKENGFKTIIDLRGGDQRHEEALWCKQLGLKYINLPMSAEAPTKKQINVFLTTVKQAQADPSRGNVFVHCAHGSDRTGCLIGIWRVSQDGWDYDQTYKEMRKYWFGTKYTKLAGAVREYVGTTANQNKQAVSDGPTSNP